MSPPSGVISWFSGPSCVFLRLHVQHVNTDLQKKKQFVDSCRTKEDWVRAMSNAVPISLGKKNELNCTKVSIRVQKR